MYSATAPLWPSQNLSITPPSGNSALDNIAWNASTQLRKIFINGAKGNGGHHSYVNYAYGEETLEEMYGAENLRRLHQLKKVYDPRNRFRYYAPLTIKDTGEDTNDNIPRRDEL